MTEIVVAAIITSAISVGVATLEAKQTKKAAKTSARLQEERLAVTGKLRKLEEARALAKTRRVARQAAAKRRNVSAAQGVIRSSFFRGAAQAGETSLARETQFAGEAAGLTAQADVISGEQISANLENTLATADNRIIAAGVTGLGDVAAAGFGV